MTKGNRLIFYLPLKSLTKEQRKDTDNYLEWKI
jgi:hypothetical protein